MPLPHVGVRVYQVGDCPTVTVDGVDVPGVTGFYVRHQKDNVASVVLELRAGTVAADLPAGVTATASGPGASDFVASLDAEELEQNVLAQMGGLDGGPATTGQAVKAVLAGAAADFDS